MRLLWLATFGIVTATPAIAIYHSYDDPSRYGGDSIPGSMSGKAPNEEMTPALLLPTHPPVIKVALLPTHPRIQPMRKPISDRPARQHRQHIDPPLPKDKAVATELQRMNGRR